MDDKPDAPDEQIPAEIGESFALCFETLDRMMSTSGSALPSHYRNVFLRAQGSSGEVTPRFRRR